MERFLSQCAAYLYRKHTNELDKLCLVFPNRRAGVFFNTYLQKQITGAVIGPHVTTINELITGYSDLYQGDKLQLISDLYDSYKAYIPTSESFDEFYFWGETLLADFDDIDRYRIDATDLFANLSGLKEMEGLFDYLNTDQKAVIEHFWGVVAGSGQKPHHQKFLSVWHKLYPVYIHFKETLKKNRTGYSGMLYRQVTDNLLHEDADLPFKRYYIIGLNAITPCEKLFFSLLKQKDKAGFLWDYDHFYSDDDKNEAGRFMRENLQGFPPPGDFELNTDRFVEKKSIKLVAVSSTNGQTQALPLFLEEIKTDFRNEFDNTAVVLADESLLYHSLGAIPVDIDPVNVTMGYPVKNAVVYGFLQLLMNLIKNRRTDENGRAVIYHRFVTDILSHQLLVNIEPEKYRDFLTELKENNRIIVTLNEINFSPLHRLIFSLPGKVNELSHWFLKILESLFRFARERYPENLLLTELIYTVCQAIEKMDYVLTKVTETQNREISEAIYFRMFNQYVGQIAVAFEGEPLGGMQLMGILETRCLDFKNLLILGLNENRWPRTTMAPSFIPYSLRRVFGLPGIDEQDAMYAYYFYRLIQRAENITATYSTIKERTGAGELSRFGFQLRYDSAHNVLNKTLDFRFSNVPVSPIEVKQSPEKSVALYERITTGKPLSPTALNTWLQCSLRFYFRYVMQLPEPDEMKDEIDSPVFGNIFHEVVENLYRPFAGKMITQPDLQKIRDNKLLIGNEIRKAIGKHYLKQKNPDEKSVRLEGKTVLFYENTKTFVYRLLEIDREIAPFLLVSLEGDYEATIYIKRDSDQIPVRLGGRIDRVDLVNDALRIIDYKTGVVESFSFKEVGELFETEKEKPKKEILQSLVYCMIYKEDEKATGVLQPAVYGLRKLFDDNFSPWIRRNGQILSYQEIEEEFRAKIRELVGEIFSFSGKYYQTPHVKNCRYCPYNKICRRY